MLLKLWNWYTKLPLWGKILGVGVLLAGLLLLILPHFFGSRFRIDRRESDRTHERTVDTALGGYADQNKVLEGLIKSKKKEMATRLNQAASIDVDTLKARERILKASSMEELLRLQEELGL